MIFQNGCSKDHILFPKKKIEICFFFKKKKKKKERKKEKEISFQKKKKKKNNFSSKSSSLELRLDLILYERGT